MYLHSWDYSINPNENEGENEKRSHRYDINRPSSRHGYKCNKYKECLSMMIHICTRQHLSNTWSSIHKKVNQHWGRVEKKGCVLKKRVFSKVPLKLTIFFNSSSSAMDYYSLRANM